MPIDVLCPGCGKTLRIADIHAGKTGRCPKCQTHFLIPGAAAPVENTPPNPWPTSTPTTPAASSPPPSQVPKSDALAGFDQFLSTSQNKSSEGNAPKTSLFGEDHSATHSPGNANPFGDASDSESQQDFSNPYAAPSTQNPMRANSAGTDLNNQAAIPIVLGIVSIGLSVMGICCCLLNLAAIPASSIGLVLTYRLPKNYRTFPLVLNILGLLMSLAWILLHVALSGIHLMNDPKFR